MTDIFIVTPQIRSTLNPSYLLALTGRDTLNKNHLKQYLSVNSNALICVIKQSNIARYLSQECIPFAQIDRTEIQLMQRYISLDTFPANYFILNDKQQSDFMDAAKLALFVSGHTHLQFVDEDKFRESTTNASYYTGTDFIGVNTGFKPRSNSNIKFQFFMCKRQPCEQQQSTRLLLRRIKSISQTIDAGSQEWCRFTQADCLGSCFPGGTALIHCSNHGSIESNINNGIKLRFTEQISDNEWHAIFNALHSNQPLHQVIPAHYIQ